MSFGRRLVLVAGAAALANAAAAQPAGQKVQQKVTGPVATYWMSAQTQTGFGAGMMGGRPSMGAMMGAMMGGGGPQKSLILQLGSSRQAPTPAAEHVPPEALRAGKSLPLVTPKAQPVQKSDETPEMPREYEKPRGRMLIFWGCGERARPGQPVVIDMAQMAAGKVPAGMAALSKGLDIRPMQPPSPARNKTYGEWPNERARTQVQGASSLAGEHVVRGNYSPEIRFSLTPDQDFLGPLNLTTNDKAPAGFGRLGWNAVPHARAYLATAIGGQEETMVLWTSSEVQASAFSMPDYISDRDVARLVASRALMGPQTTTCSVPKEVLDAAPQAMVQLVAYGDEANFVYPPRPQDPKVDWNQEWQVKVRYRSATGGMLGMAMPGMDDPGDEDDGPRAQRPAQDPRAQDPRAQDPKAKRRNQMLKGLGGALGVPIP
ncbi:hypothetical protein [Phenylobacterium sp.]|uniref:hypothetical protein n=1 Tax=Phenylobacterium sp. TaxID=1871053 RepID=UPI003962343C